MRKEIGNTGLWFLGKAFTIEKDMEKAEDNYGRIKKTIERMYE